MTKQRSGQRRAVAWLWLALKGIVIGGILVYLLAQIWSNWGALQSRVVKADFFFLGAMVFFQVFGMVFLALLWRELMIAMGETLRVGLAVRMQWLAALGKYVPGKFGTVLGKVYLGGVEGVSRELVGLACVYEILLCFAASALVVLLSISFGHHDGMLVCTVPSIVFAAVILVCMHPAILLRVVNWGLARAGRKPIVKALSYPKTLLFVVGYMIPYVMGGVSEFALLRAFYEVPTMRVVDVIGITALATSLGFAALFAPGGLGIRDGLMAWGLSLLVPRPGAVFVALAGRIAGLALDFAAGVISLVMYGGIPWRRRVAA